MSERGIQPSKIININPKITAYNLRSNNIDPELTGDILTRTSERIAKKLILESLNNITENNQTMPSNTQDSAMMICYRECLSNLEKFHGGEDQKILQFINNIERIGRMIDANDDILYCMCTAKLNGEAKHWYENNTSLTQWEHLKLALIERFAMSDSSSRIFEQLKERKQKPDETITSYYDAIIRLCQEYDPSMSQKMMVSWLENGIKDSLKIQIKRQMKMLPETTRTTQAFLKIAKDEQELQEIVIPRTEETTSFTPYFANTVSTALRQTNNIHSSTLTKPQYPSQTTTSQSYRNPYQQQTNFSMPQKPLVQTRRTSLHQTQSGSNPAADSSNINIHYPQPCSICRRNNHRTIDCYHKQAYGCYKCGQSDHRLRDCPTVFY